MKKIAFIVVILLGIYGFSFAKDLKLVLKNGNVVALHDADQDITIKEHYPEADEIIIVPENTPMTGIWGNDPDSTEPMPDPRPSLDQQRLKELEAKERGKKFKAKVSLKEAIKEAKSAGDTEAEAELQKELDELSGTTTTLNAVKR
jgi:hypothetical protein